MILTTAYTENISEIGEMCAESLRRYCARFPHHKYEVWTIPKQWDRAPSWYKVGVIRDLLTYGETVMWIDADALVVGKTDVDSLMSDHTLHIAKDCNGINCGVMAWQPTTAAIQALQRIESLYQKHSEHKWFEQAALMEFVDELNVRYQPKPTWNAYPKEVDGEGDVDATTLVIHYPGMEHKERVAAMREVFSNLAL